MDTKGLVQEGIRIVGGVMAAAILMLGLIAYAHDGEVATTIVQQLIGVLVWGMPALAVLLGVNQVAAAAVSVKQANVQANAQAAATQAAAQPAPVVVPISPASPVSVAESAL